MKKILVSILSIILILSFAIGVNADTRSVSAVVNVNKVKKGDSFTVTISAVSDTPIDGMYTKFNYDTDVLELTSKTPGTGYGDNSSSGEILVTNNSSGVAPTSGTLYTLTFKVLDNAKSGSTSISFSESELHLNLNGVVSEDKNDISSVSVTIESEGSDQGDENTLTPSNNTSNTNTNSNTSNNSSNKTDSTKKDTKKIAQTGINDIVLISIAALSILATIFYISYKKYNNF